MYLKILSLPEHVKHQFLPGAKHSLTEHAVIGQTSPFQGEPHVFRFGLLALGNPAAPETDTAHLLNCWRVTVVTGYASTPGVTLTIGGL